METQVKYFHGKKNLMFCQMHFSAFFFLSYFQDIMIHCKSNELKVMKVK